MPIFLAMPGRQQGWSSYFVTISIGPGDGGAMLSVRLLRGLLGSIPWMQNPVMVGTILASTISNALRYLDVSRPPEGGMLALPDDGREPACRPLAGFLRGVPRPGFRHFMSRWYCAHFPALFLAHCNLLGVARCGPDRRHRIVPRVQALLRNVRGNRLRAPTAAPSPLRRHHLRTLRDQRGVIHGCSRRLLKGLPVVPLLILRRSRGRISRRQTRQCALQVTARWALPIQMTGLLLVCRHPR
jgi:hypothetical protein